MKMFKPLNERILAKLTPRDKRMGELYLPEGMDESPEAEIIAMGDGVVTVQGTRITPAVKVGDRIYFDPRGSRKLKIEGEEIFQITERQIFGIVE